MWILGVFLWPRTAYFESLPGWFVFTCIWQTFDSFQWPTVEPFAGLVAFWQVGFEICNSLGKKSPRRKALLGFLEGWKSTLGPCFGIPTFQHRTKRAQSKSTIWWWLVLCVIACECNIYIWITHIYDLCMCIRCAPSYLFWMRYDMTQGLYILVEHVVELSTHEACRNT